MLVKHLKENDKLNAVLVPSHNNCSVLLYKAAGSNVDDLKEKLAYKEEKYPRRTKP